MSLEVIKYGNVEGAVSAGNEEAIFALISKVVAAAKVSAPFDSGQLRNSIMGRSSIGETGFNSGGGKRAGQELSDRKKKGEGIAGSNLSHAIYNEFGTRKMAAEPFLRPAVASEASGAQVREAIKKLQKKSVAVGMKKGPRKKKVFK